MAVLLKSVALWMTLFLGMVCCFKWERLPNSMITSRKSVLVTFSWKFKAGAQDDVQNINWIYADHSNSRLIATKVLGHFLPTELYAQRVRHVINAGLSLSDVTSADTGTYSVEVHVNRSGDFVSHRHFVYLNEGGEPGVRIVSGVVGLPRKPGKHRVPEKPRKQGKPGVPRFSGLPGVPRLPGLPELPGFPRLPGLQGLPVVPANRIFALLSHAKVLGAFTPSSHLGSVLKEGIVRSESSSTATPFAYNKEAPGAPQHLTAIGLTETSVRLTWSPPAGNTDIISYQITGHKQGDAANKKDLITKADTLVIAVGLKRNTNYVFKIRAYTSKGAGPWSRGLHYKTARSTRVSSKNHQDHGEPARITTPRETPPYLRKKPKTHVQAVEGKKVMFLCKVNGKPSPSHVWYRGDQRIPFWDPRTTTSRYALRISSVGKQDEGVYRCQATNPHGEIWVNFTLSVEEDPCENYKVLDDVRRDVKGPGGTMCDDNLALGWYRFRLNGADAVMPTECVHEVHCGTRYPYWLDLQGEQLPAVGQEKVARACASRYWQCCWFRTPVTIRNCGAFFLYKLEAPKDCALAYCAKRV